MIPLENGFPLILKGAPTLLSGYYGRYTHNGRIWVLRISRFIKIGLKHGYIVRAWSEAESSSGKLTDQMTLTEGLTLRQRTPL